MLRKSKIDKQLSATNMRNVIKSYTYYDRGIIGIHVHRFAIYVHDMSTQVYTIIFITTIFTYLLAEMGRLEIHLFFLTILSR